jgi:hypothetical protein
MVAMKKSAMLLALMTFMVFGTSVAQAQATGLVTCTATAVPPVVRAEGIAELVGDIVLACITTNSAQFAPGVDFLVNVSVSLNVNVTNNINFGAGTNVTDAVLVVNENNCTSPNPLGNLSGTCGAPFIQYQDPQFGFLAANNRLEWNEVRFPVPSALRTGFDPNPPVTTVRVTSMRANASQLGVPSAATFPSTQVTAFVSITGPTAISVNNNVLNVAVPILGLIVTPGDVVTGLQCLDTTVVTNLRLTEGFATSFKTIGRPTFMPGSTQVESGYYAPGSNNGGGASQSTRFLIRFFNIPQGVTIRVPKDINTGTPAFDSDAIWLRLVAGADSNGAGGTAVSATDNQTVSLSGGFGSVTYEVIDSDPFRLEWVNIPITVSWTADTANDLPAIGTGQVSASFAPLSTVVVASNAAPEPRFLDTSGDPRTFISIIRCTTTLLFPFVTNQAGFDTGMAISNTSQDWLGTDPQAGACDIHYHGATTGGGAAPAPQTSTVIAGGEQLIFTLSGGNALQNIAGAPEFQGYVIAVCEFQYGHGFAFITDGFGGIPALAQGYLALVIPVTDSGERVPGVPNLHRLGESLSH